MKETFPQVVEKIPSDIRQEVIEDFQDIMWSKTLVDILPVESPLRKFHQSRLDYWEKELSPNHHFTSIVFTSEIITGL